VPRVAVAESVNGFTVRQTQITLGSLQSRMVVVRATLVIPKYEIAIEQFGGNDNPDRGDAYKGACTDAGLNPEQAVRVFNHMRETLHARE
jgi:hypothetical protein